MFILNKLKCYIRYIKKYDVIQSLCWYFKLNLPNLSSFRVYPNSIIDIDKGAMVDIQDGELAINVSWFAGRKRRYVSELRVMEGGKLIIGGNFSLYQGASIFVAKNATLHLGKNSFLNTNTTLNCFHHIEIGSGCAISDNVCIHDSDSHVLNGNKDMMSAPVIIEDNVWIGKNVIILKGVTIGEGAVIGAGSVVSKSIPPRCLAVGNPAKIIKENIYWTNE